jgi:AraC-like DNA-binding protein
MYPSTLASWTLLIAKGLESCGCDVDALFRQAGLDPEKLRIPGSRFNQASIIKLWKIAEDASHDPCFGVNISRYWHPSTFHALGYSWLASATLKDGFHRLARYAAVVNNILRVGFDLEEDDRYRFSLTIAPLPLESLHVGIDAGLATVVRMCRINFGEEFRPLSVLTTRPEPSSIDTYKAFFRCPITFSSDTNTLYFKKTDIEKPLPTSNADLALKSDQMAIEYLARYQHDDIVFKIKALLINKLPAGEINDNEIAGAVNMSKRTLQRKLQRQGSSISSLLDETRKELAVHYLENSVLTIGEITYLVGFSEPANFSRAFKRWMNTSPNVYRSIRHRQSHHSSAASSASARHRA